MLNLLVTVVFFCTIIVNKDAESFDFIIAAVNNNLSRLNYNINIFTKSNFIS